MCSRQVPIPPDSLEMLWNSAFKSSADMFVEGFVLYCMLACTPGGYDW